jgi:catechol 2,3-dioxygenase-like lactoylglutathione lyase family enzyme
MTEQTGNSLKLKPHHMAINVADIEASIRWYCDVLGFSVKRRNFIPTSTSQNALLNNDDFNIELFQHKRIIQGSEDETTEPPGTEALGFRQMAFEANDLHALTEMLKKKGVNITRLRPDGTVLFIRDNSGNVLEFVPAGRL